MAAPPTRRSQRIALRASSAVANPDHKWRDWAGLSPDLLTNVANRVLDNDVFDLLQLRAVCRPWKKETPDPRRPLGAGVIDHRLHPRRWITLPGSAGGGGTRRKLLNVTTRKVVEVDLPLLAGGAHAVVAGSAAAPEGVLVLRDEATLVVRLLNPLTGHVVALPSVRTIQRGSRKGPISNRFKEEHTVTAAGFADESTIVIYFGEINKMAVAKPGDVRWTLVGGLQSPLLSTLTYQGRFYCIDHQRLLVVNTTVAAQRPQLVVVADLNRRLHNVHMVDNKGRLMVVCSRNVRLHAQRSELQTVVDLFHVDLEAGTVLAIHDLGGQAVFAGSLGAVLLPSTRHYVSVNPDTVYFRFGQSQRYFCAFRVGRQRTAYLRSFEGKLANYIASYVTCTHSE